MRRANHIIDVYPFLPLCLDCQLDSQQIILCGRYLICIDRSERPVEIMNETSDSEFTKLFPPAS